MLISLLSMLGGGLLRLLPEVFAYLNKKTDNAHELAMMDKQAELEKTRSAMRQEEIQTQGQADMNLAEMNALTEALRGQMQLTGIRIVDALNMLVRPVTTYYLLALYGLAKLAMYMLARLQGIGGWEAILRLYDADDRAILSGVLGFWFVSRSITQAKK
jgi:hypothetical protein